MEPSQTKSGKVFPKVLLNKMKKLVDDRGKTNEEVNEEAFDATVRIMNKMKACRV